MISLLQWGFLRFFSPLFAMMIVAAPLQAADESAMPKGAPPEAVARWQSWRFGMFIHWGPISIKGEEIGWSRQPGPDGNTTRGSIPANVYDNLYKEFNPVKFDARQWARIAQEAGMKYVVFTSKHHDGFCEFDSAWTDYKSTGPACPFGRDAVADLAVACREAGLGFGIYYSQPDCHHPDYRTANHNRYLEYMHKQVRELLSKYGKVDVIWFDGLTGTAADWDAPRLVSMIRQLQPNILVNDRCGVSADFLTPEQTIGAYNTQQPWESCITIGNQWAWRPDDEMKSSRECIQTLIRCAAGDGNLLLNIGPMPSGEIESRQAERLKEIGRWLSQFGEGVYETRGGPFEPRQNVLSTHRNGVVYIHMLESNAEPVVLPALPEKVVRGSVLTGGMVEVAQDDRQIVLKVTPEHRDEIDTIIKLELQ